MAQGMVKRFAIFIAIFSVFAFCHAQERGPWNGLISRLERFGQSIPQEKVYIHMDNTCYFLGDSIWFKAYLRQTSNDKPSQLSGTLYVELLNNEGYLVERKLIEMKNGEGNGYFHLPDDSLTYAGFYELRAYTRWQLNWGAYEHQHNTAFNRWFGTKTMCKEYFRDYEKLYSRVFPVYNKPIDPGEFHMDMTERPLQRLYKTDLPKHNVKFYPEGGNMIAGVKNYVAYELTTDSGATRRGIMEVVPQKDEGRNVQITIGNGDSIKVQLPKSDEIGVALHVSCEEEVWRIQTKVVGLPTDSLAMTILHEGKLQRFEPLNGEELKVPKTDLPCGVNQVTIFDTQGRVFADRLFFVTKMDEVKPSLTISTPRHEYFPYEQINIGIRSLRTDSSRVSVSVRDKLQSVGTHDTGNILTEMLLASEIRGFVPDPDYYFEADDEEHRQALDLLMMTQGWRRFNWRDMAVKGEWDIAYKPERTPMISGSVNRYGKYLKYDPKDITRKYGNSATASFIKRALRSSSGIRFRRDGEVVDEMGNVCGDDTIPFKEIFEQLELDYGLQVDDARSNLGDIGKLKNDMKIHMELVKPGSENSVIGEMTTQEGQFQFSQPRFYGECILFLTASDTTKWSKKTKTMEFQWIMPNEEEFPEYSIRLSFPYPRFVKPYAYMQTQTRNLDSDDLFDREAVDDHTLGIVQVKAKRRGLRSYSNAIPVLRMDAYEAYNAVVDAGLMDAWYNLPLNFAHAVTRMSVSDMGNNADYLLRVAYGDLLTDQFAQSAEDMSTIDGMSPDQATYEYSFLYNLDSVCVFTDYAPRLEGDNRYMNGNKQRVVCLLKRFDDNTKRATYRDRCIILKGFAHPAEFYSPDYSQRPMPEPKDYRRTLYWNPNVKLDEQGEAHITFYNNSRHTHLQIDAQGQATDGTLLFSK